MNHYDRKKGWELTKPGWHELQLYVAEPAETITKHLDILKWIYDNIGKCEYHCRWMYNGNYLHYKFRYEKDYLWFKIRWG